VEDRNSAEARGAVSYGRIAGYAASFDPAPGVARPRGLRRAAELALADAQLSVRDVDVVFADGMALPGDDRDEAEALVALFGPFGVPVTVPKTMTGRLLGAGAGVDVATALMALQEGLIPPTVFEGALVRDVPRAAPLRTALILARGILGFNSALVVCAD